MTEPHLIPRDRILDNALIREVFSSYGSACGEIYLVGGYLRDLIISGVHANDIDFVVTSNVMAIARGLAESHGGSVVKLRKDKVVRLVLTSGRTVDVSALEQPIEGDLLSRDFSMNALAWSPQSGLIDPAMGSDDIGNHLIKAIKKENFVSDPLRLLRAYRFCSELKWHIDGGTRAMIRDLCRAIRRPAAERITLEIIRLLNASEPFEALLMAVEDGVLGEIISLDINRLVNNVKHISMIKEFLDKVPVRICFNDMPQGLTYLGLLRLEALLLGAKGSLLALSRPAQRRLSAVGKHYDRFGSLDTLTKGERWELYKSAGDAAIDLMILRGRADLSGEIEEYRRQQERPLLSADEIMSITGLPPGPEIGGLADQLKRLRFEGRIKSREDVKAWLTGVS